MKKRKDRYRKARRLKRFLVSRPQGTEADFANALKENYNKAISELYKRHLSTFNAILNGKF